MRGVYAMAVLLSSILAILALAASFFSLDRLNAGFLDYRRAAYQSYLQHDVEYSLHRVVDAVRDYCRVAIAEGSVTTCEGVASTAFASFVSAWASNGFSITGGGLSVVVLPDNGVEVRLLSDLHWRKGGYGGTIPAGYGG